MDPLPLTAAVVSLSWKAFEIGNKFNDLRLKYKEAGATIDAICIESEVVHASLNRVRRLFENEALTRPKSDELYEVFYTAVTGCDVVLSCLNEEAKKLKASALKSGSFGWKLKVKFIWKEEAMADLLNRLRGQREAIILLFQSIQIESPTEIHHLLRDRAGEANRYELSTNHLRGKYPNLDIPELVSGIHRKESSVFEDDASAISTTESCFDDQIVNSAANRRALSAAQEAVREQRGPDRAADGDCLNRTIHGLDACETPRDAPPSCAPPMKPGEIATSKIEAEQASEKGHTAKSAMIEDKSSEIFSIGVETVVYPPRASSLQNGSGTPVKPTFERKDSAVSYPLVAAREKARIPFKRNDSVLPTDESNEEDSSIDEESSDSDSEIEWEKYVSRRPPIPTAMPVPDAGDLSTQTSDEDTIETPHASRKARKELKSREIDTKLRKNDVLQYSTLAVPEEYDRSNASKNKTASMTINSKPSCLPIPTVSNMTVSDATRLLKEVQLRAAKDRKAARQQKREQRKPGRGKAAGAEMR